MKLLFTQDALVNAGAERSHLEILSRFSEEVDVGFVYFYPKHDLREAYERAGIRLFFLDIPEGYHFTLAIRRLVSLIRKEKPDLLVSSLWRADIITRIASWLTGVPLVGTLVNDSYAPMAWTDKKGFKYKVVYWVDRLTASIPVHWIANAQALADSHVKTLGIECGKISVVYRGRAVPNMETPGGNVIARTAGTKQSLTLKTASAAKSFDIKSEISDFSLPPQRAGAVTNPEETASPDSVGIAVTDDVIASAAKQSFEENSKPKEKIASATKSPEDNSTLKESSLAMTSPEETASAAESFDIKSEISNSSLAVTAVTDDVIASDAGVKQSFTDKKTASAADASEDNSDFPNSSLAVTIPGETASPNSVGIELTQPERNTSPRSVSSPSETSIKNFISFGRLLERKGFQDAIRAFSEVLKTYPDCTLTIFGEGPYRIQLETLIQDLNLQKSVFLPGKIQNPVDVLMEGFYFPSQGFDLHNSRCLDAQPDKLQLSLASRLLTPKDHQLLTDHCQLTTADCFLFPSWYEGFSGALVEAMMAGIPIIASDIPMNLEAVTDSKTALTFKVGDSQDLLEKMIFAIEHPDQMVVMGKQARREAEERFDIEKIAREYEGVVKSLTPPWP